MFLILLMAHSCVSVETHINILKVDGRLMAGINKSLLEFIHAMLLTVV